MSGRANPLAAVDVRNALAQAPPADTRTVKWAPAGKDPDYRTVWADVGKLDQSWRKDPDFYVGAGGQGGIRNRYADFGDWMQGGLPVEMPHAALDYRGEAMFGNGRHRFAWLRDQGASAIPVKILAEHADEFRSRFGTNERKTILSK